ncbi:hypothetical protein LQ327_20555 [Actinomycetospora endophytica]|uniref:DUF317 domain-containing protein n=1 Tax=Actinomycetospora endophytica TaxID=2291215 RepID=A0ABS8PBX9_9PSEU|nr:hypothetical protein [Actinomycetospora endophytica]MCD2195767.1 hypothetical protein [Actinomycetospora endophytica]
MATTAPAEAHASSSYTLVYNPPDDPAGEHVLGWSLVAYGHGRRRWSTNLAAHGAPATADLELAQTVASRVLTDQGVSAGRWVSTEPDGLSRGPANDPLAVYVRSDAAVPAPRRHRSSAAGAGTGDRPPPSR